MKNDIYEFDRFRDIMATKACKCSIKIGDGLANGNLKKIINRLSELNMPWRCPHGRLTFKILIKL